MIGIGTDGAAHVRDSGHHDRLAKGLAIHHFQRLLSVRGHRDEQTVHVLDRPSQRNVVVGSAGRETPNRFDLDMVFIILAKISLQVVRLSPR